MYEKIALVFNGNIEYCPYIKAYERILCKENIAYDVLFWEREKFPVKYPDNYKWFELEAKLTKKKTEKLIDFVRYSFWLRRQLKREKYTKLIYLNTLSGMLVYWVKRSFRKIPSMLEIRDYSYERIGLFKVLEKKMIQSMDKTFISSKAFRKFLPEGKYIVTHNLDGNEYQQARSLQKFVKKPEGVPLNIVYIGSVSYFSD